MEKLEAGDFTIATEGEQLVVSGLQKGDLLNVYSASGLTVASMVATDAVAKLGGLQSGALYILVVTRDGKGSTALKLQL